jgi:hypothetical protein
MFVSLHFSLGYDNALINGTTVVAVNTLKKDSQYAIGSLKI